MIQATSFKPQIIFILCFIAILFCGCEKGKKLNNSTITEKTATNLIDSKSLDNKNEISGREDALYSYDKTVRLLKQQVGEEINFRKDVKFTYSIAMHTDSFFIVSYKPPTYKGNIFDADISTRSWQAVKNEIIDLYERIQFAGVDCDVSYLRERYEINESIPILNFHTSSFRFLSELAKLGDKISAVDANASLLLIDSDGFNKSSGP